MSTNDAAVSELRVVGGETRTQLYRTAGATRTTRQQQNETFDGGFQKQNHHGTQTGQHFQHAPTGRQKTQAELIFGDRQREEGKLPGCGEPKLQTCRPVGTRFTSSLSFQLSRELSSAQQELKPKNKPDHCLHRCEFGERHSQVNERESPAETSVEAANDLSSSSSERISFPVKRKEDVITLISNVLETTYSSGVAHRFSDGKLGPYDYNCLHTVSQHGSQLRRTGLESLETEEATEDFTRLENQNHLFELSDPTVTMLSSTMVSVLAPHWNSRLRRGKRGMATGNLDDEVNVPGVTYGSSTEANSAREHFRETQSQHAGERGLRDGFQEPLRASFLGTRRKTVDWSTKSGPASVNLDYECKRKVVQSVSVDGPGRLDNRKIGGGVFSPVATTSSAMSSLSLDLNEQGRAPLASQGELSPSSSTPTTSSRLLSLRRLNSNWRSSPSEKNPVPQLSPTFLNNNEQDRLKCTPYSSAISYKTAETDPTVSPSLSKHRERNVSKDYSDSEDVPISQPSQKTSTFSCPQQTSLTKELEKQQNYRHSNTRTDHMSESSRLSPYDGYAFLKSRSLGRRTTLTSTSWWKQVTQESSSPLGPNNTTNIYDKNKNKTSTPLITPSNTNIDLPTQNPVDNKRLSSQIPNSRQNNSTVESVYKANLNIVMKAQGGPHTLRRSNAEDTPDQELDRCLKHQNGFNLNNRETAKPHSLVSVPSMSKFSGAAGQTTLSHAKNVAVTELQNTLLNPKSLNTPTEKNDLTANTQPYTALFIPPSTSSPTTSNVTLSKTTSFTDQAENKSSVNSELPPFKLSLVPFPAHALKLVRSSAPNLLPLRLVFPLYRLPDLFPTHGPLNLPGQAQPRHLDLKEPTPPSLSLPTLKLYLPLFPHPTLVFHQQTIALYPTALPSLLLLRPAILPPQHPPAHPSLLFPSLLPFHPLLLLSPPHLSLLRLPPPPSPEPPPQRPPFPKQRIHFQAAWTSLQRNNTPMWRGQG
ncbi:flocculation protein FLO11-like [Myripristis murdjan]|uniref:flocculation protein FLO11-like n=1 Tax=Myripristis murdjan TaxID=586833 RepID=UPI0011760B34|nr:flocculation protein FLO11-like [Myripristis murdjan]